MITNLQKKHKIQIFSSPFTEEAADLLEKLKYKFYKIASFTVDDLNLIKKVTITNRPDLGFIDAFYLKILSLRTLFNIKKILL